MTYKYCQYLCYFCAYGLAACVGFLLKQEYYFPALIPLFFVIFAVFTAEEAKRLSKNEQKN